MLLANLVLDHMTESDRIQMAVSYEQVMELIGDIPGCTRRDIENCLWRYYYDVPKTVDHVLSANQSVLTSIFRGLPLTLDRNVYPTGCSTG